MLPLPPTAPSSHPFQPLRLPPELAVKSPNILLTASGTAKLQDCGFSKTKHDSILSSVAALGTCELAAGDFLCSWLYLGV